MRSGKRGEGIRERKGRGERREGRGKEEVQGEGEMSKQPSKADRKSVV